MTDPKLNIRIVGDLTAIKSSLADLRKDLGTLGSQAAKSGQQSARSLSNIERAATSLRRAIVGVVTSFAALQGVRLTLGLADQFLQLNGVLGIATQNSEELAAAQKGVYEIAQRTRAPIQETANTYATLERTTKTLGLSQTELLRTLETVNKSIGLTPVSAQAAQASLVQFGQALGGDFKAGAQELNSILEQTPGLAISIARGLGVQTSELKKLGEEGKLSAELVVRGLLRISNEVDEKFSKVPRTLSGAFTQIRNDLLVTLGNTDLSPLLEALDDFRSIITDPAVVAGLSAIARGIVNISSAALSGIGHVRNFARFIGEELASAISGPAADDLVRLSERIQTLRDLIRDTENGDRLFFFGGKADEIKRLREELSQLEATYADSRRAAEEAASAAARLSAAEKAAAEAAAKKAEEDFKKAEAARARKQQEEAATKELERQQKQIRNMIADLEEEAAIFGRTTEEVVRYQLALLGATDAQIEQGVIAARRLQQLKDEEQLQKDLTKLAKERAEAEDELATKLADARARLSDTTGFATARLELERQRDELLRLVNEVDPNDQASRGLVERIFNVELARARARDIEEQAQQLLDRLRQTEDNFALQDQAGNAGVFVRERQIQNMRQRTIEQLEELRQKLLEVLRTETDPAAQQAAADALAGLDNEILRVKEAAETLKNNIKDVGQSSLQNFFTNLATGAMKARDAIRQLVVDFVQGLARMAAEALAKRAILSLASAFSNGASSAATATVAHGGGMAGHGMKRKVPAGVFAFARRFHNGGVAGLNPGEVPAILKRGERVLNPQETREYGKQAPAPGVRLVNVFDPSFVPDQMDSAAGEKVILNVIGRNPGRVRQLLG